MTSWADIKLFHKKRNIIVLASRNVFSQRLITVRPRQYNTLEFSLEVAKSILLMSSIIYERDHKLVKAAFDGGELEQVVKNLWESKKEIHKVAKEWGCKFMSIADFQKAAGPLVGAFYDLDADPCPYMVVVFKGTSPDAVSDWIADATLTLISSGEKLGAGFAHQGFYTSLFPSASAEQHPSPYLRIINATTKVAEEWLDQRNKSYRESAEFKDRDVRMNLFVGGHSLGAGIASLFYAPLLESPEDLGEHAILRDAYCFGTPRACDGILASKVEYNFGKPINFRRTLWRVINKASSQRVGDIVTHVPPGMADHRVNRSAFRVGSF